MRSRSLVGLVAGCALLAACEGLKEALTAHVDVVARAGTQELSVNRLGELLGNAKIQVPVSRETAAILTDIWTGYQQIAYAAAHGDSLNDHKAIDVALAPMANASRLNMFMDSVTKTFKVDSGSEAAYNQAAGGLIAARHILIAFKNPQVPPTAAEKDSVRKKAEAILPQVNAANFAEMAKKYDNEPNAAQTKGYLGVFPKGQMVAQFYDAAAALKPGEISKLVETQFGFHIIQRLTYADAQKDFAQQYAQISARLADSTYLEQAKTAAKIQVKDNAPAAIKEAAKEPAKHRTDKATLATFNGGELTTGDFISWMESVPPQQCDPSAHSRRARFGAQAVPPAGRAAAGPSPPRRQCSRDAEGRGQSEHVLVDRAARGQPRDDARRRAEDARRQREERSGKGTSRRVARGRVPRPHDGGTGSADHDSASAQEAARREVRVVGQLGRHRSRSRACAEAPQIGGLDARGESAQVTGSAPRRRRASCGTSAARCAACAARAGADQAADDEETVVPFSHETHRRCRFTRTIRRRTGCCSATGSGDAGASGRAGAAVGAARRRGRRGRRSDDHDDRSQGARAGSSPAR